MPTDNVEEIKSKIDVVDLIQEYIQLKPAGTNSFKANCPFHNEKTPSFMVSRDKQIWHCFGCSEGGDIFSFIQKIEGLEFPEALRILAKKAGVRLQYQDPAISNQKTRLLDVCTAAASFYHKILLDHEKAQFGRDYLKKRQIREETVETWQLGYAPDAWDVLNTYLVQRGFKEDDVFQAGLTLKKDRGVGYIDRFRNRLMFPIWDAHDTIIGFGGRWLGEEKENVGKYINSPQTLIYDKSSVLYGLDKAKQEIKKRQMAVVVEGYMDCISSHQADVTNVVASSGTALTLQQVKLLKRFTTNIAFAFDGDLAGNNAARRGIETSWQEEMSTRVIVLPEGAKDPDELIKSDTAKWAEAIRSARSVMEYYFESTLKNTDLASVDDKKRIAKELLPVIAKLVDPIEQTHYIQKLSSVLSVEEHVLRDKTKQLLLRQKPSPRVREESARVTRDRFTVIGENVIGIAFRFTDQLNYIIDHLTPEELPGGTLQELYKRLIIYYTEKHIFDYGDFTKTLPAGDEGNATYAEVLSLRIEHDFGEYDSGLIHEVVVNGIRELKNRAIHERIHNVEQEMKKAESSGDQQKIDDYSKRFTTLMEELKRVE